MTTPDTSAVRAWARSNGYDVADRGRLPAELTDAYLAAQGEKAAPAKKAAAKKTPGRKPAAKKAASAKAAPARKPAATTAPKPAPKPAPGPAAAPAPTPTPAPTATAEPKPKPLNDDRRLVALGEQLTALTARVAELEKAAGSKPSGNGVAKRFRRSR